MRDDGLPQGDGSRPALIEWQAGHPTERLPPSPWALQTLTSDPLRATLVGAAGLLTLEC